MQPDEGLGCCKQRLISAFAKISNVNCKHIPRDVDCNAVKWMQAVEELAKHRFLGDPANEKHVISRMERAHIAYSGKYL